MELRQIQYFTQLYKDCNFTRASRNLFISQQGLSKAIGKLEEELGITLFERSSSGVMPTEAARRLHGAFENVMSACHLLDAAIREVQDEKKLRIIAPHGFGLTQKREDFAGIKNRHPQINVEYRECHNHLIGEMLHNGTGDLAIMMPPIPKGVERHLTLEDNPLFAVMSENHPLAGRDSLMVRDLNGQSLQYLDMYENVKEILVHEVEATGIAYRLHSVATISELLHSLYYSENISFATESLFQYINYPGLVFLPFLYDDGRPMSIEMILVTSHRSAHNRDVENYIEYLRENIGQPEDAAEI